MYSNDSSKFTCGQYANIPGRYNSGTSINIFSLTGLVSHIQYRVIVWVLWIDNWSNSNNITINDGGYVVGRYSYSSASGRQQN